MNSDIFAFLEQKSSGAAVKWREVIRFGNAAWTEVSVKASAAFVQVI